METCYIWIDPNVNEWVRGTIVRQVVGMPNSFVIDVDGHKYRRNKRNLTLVPQKPNNSESDESDGNNHQSDQSQQMRDEVRPTLHLRPTIKLPSYQYRQ